MKKLLTLTLPILVLSLSSCSLKQIDQRGLNEFEDILFKESLTRTPKDKLREQAFTLNEKNPYLTIISRCHLKENTQNLFNKYYKKDHKESIYWFSRGICAQTKGEITQSVFFYDHAANQNNFSTKIEAAILNNLAIISLNAGHFQEARQQLLESHQTYNNNTSLLNLTLLQLQFSQLNQAEKNLSKLYSQNSHDPSLIFAYSILYLFKGNHDMANEYFKRLDKDFLKRADTSIYYGLNLYMKGEYEKAFQSLARGDFTQINSLKTLSEDLREKTTTKLEQEQ